MPRQPGHGTFLDRTAVLIRERNPPFVLFGVADGFESGMVMARPVERLGLYSGRRAPFLSASADRMEADRARLNVPGSTTRSCRSARNRGAAEL